MPLKQIMTKMITSKGNDVLSLSKQRPVLLVFLRHFGCVFCREAIHDLSQMRITIEESGNQLVFVHMSDEDTAVKYFNEYNLNEVNHISDPECRFYASFGLTKGSFVQLMGLKNMTRGFEASFQKGIFPNHKFIGDGFQMPGVFLIKNGEIEKSFIHKFAGEKPDYLGMID